MNVLSSWGNLAHQQHRVHYLDDRRNVGEVIGRFNPGIAYGMGRSYGDACLNVSGHVWNTRMLDNLIRFDSEKGLLCCEAGALLRDIQRLLIPRGWMLPVTPGTQFVTVGGAIANDVHGKNHHQFGCFGEHMNWLKLVRSDGEIIECSATQNQQWFRATVAGLGLTGVIVEAEIRLKRIQSPWMYSESIPFASLEDFFQLSDASEQEWEHSAAWIDCLPGKIGAGIFLRGNMANNVSRELPHSKDHEFPFMPPISLINRVSLRLFNRLYTAVNRKRKSITHYETFLYPLDKLLYWNRIYGRQGFYQYQCVLPHKHRLEATKALLQQISQSDEGSFLTVLKTFGNRQATGLMSFPIHGVTLALDFPNKGDQTLALFNRLDTIVSDAGGRVYLAKDARLPAHLFAQFYPGYEQLRAFRDPGISSDMSRRLTGS